MALASIATRRRRSLCLPPCSSLHPSSNYLAYPAMWSSMTGKRFRSGIFFSDERGTAEENVYFKKEEETLLKNLLSEHPEYNPKYLATTLESEVGTLERDLHLVCKKHGVSHVSLAFLHDIQKVFEMHGWKKQSAEKSFQTKVPKG